MSLSQLGRYKITSVLGRGAMGTVYQAHDPLIEREVAIKAISCAGLTRDEAEEFEQRFFREAKSAGQLTHPNIVTIHDVGRSGELSYIAMEFLVGHSLRDILDTHVSLPVERIVQIAAEIADGLAFAHARGIVHRDIKPGNIMVLDNGSVKITDFGIAQLPSSSLTLIGTAMGTPKYMSPEQVNGHKADGRSDIFSLGAVLYEMLTGRPPFSGAELNAILYQVLNGAPPLPSSINPALPPGFDRIVARAMAKDADKRYANAAEMASDLRKVRQLPGLLQTPTDNPPAVSKNAAASASATEFADTVVTRTRRRPTRAVTLLIALVILMAVLAAGVFILSRTTGNKSTTGNVQPATRVEAPASPASEDAAKPADSAARTTSANRPESSDASEAPAAIKPKAEKRAVKRDAAKVSPDKPQAASPGNWHSALQASIRACDSESFFRRILCVDKARRQYCPGHWDSVPECSTQTRR